MGTAQQALDIARGELGTTENPFGSNKTKYGRAYGMDGYAWCMMFMWWVLTEADAYDILKTAYTPTAADAYKKAGRWTQNPRPGDLVFFYWASMGRIAHVGIVESVGDGYVNTIEGNTDESGGRTGGKVMRRRRTLGSSIPGFGRPKYSDNTTPIITPPIEEDWMAVLKGKNDNDKRDYLKKLIRVEVRKELRPLKITLRQLSGESDELERVIREAVANIDTDLDEAEIARLFLQYVLEEEKGNS